MAKVQITHSLSGFTFDDELVQEFGKYIEVVNRDKSFWGQFCTPDSSKVGDKLTIERQVIINPDVAKDVLAEGGTPRKEDIKIMTYDLHTATYGSYIEYSREAFKKNKHSVIDMARNQLANSRLADVEAVRSAAYTATPNSVTKGASETYFDLLLRVSAQLMKNGAVADSKGNYDLVITPELRTVIVKEAMGLGITLGKDASAILRNGFIGEYAGFNLYVHKGDEMYGEGKVKMIFIGKTESGKFPVISRFADEANVEVISKEIGSAGTLDPLDQTGTIGSRIDDMAAALEYPECVYICEVTLAALTAKRVGTTLTAAAGVANVGNAITGNHTFADASAAE